MEAQRVLGLNFEVQSAESSFKHALERLEMIRQRLHKAELSLKDAEFKVEKNKLDLETAQQGVTLAEKKEQLAQETEAIRRNHQAEVFQAQRLNAIMSMYTQGQGQLEALKRQADDANPEYRHTFLQVYQDSYRRQEELRRQIEEMGGNLL